MIDDQIQPQPNPGEYIRTYYQSMSTAVWIPAAQAVITGISAGAVAGSAAWLVEYGRPWPVLFTTATIAHTITWLSMLRRWKDLIWRIESALGVDLEQDGVAGQLDQRQAPIRVEVIQDRKIQIVDLPAQQDQLIDLATGLLRGVPFSEAQWTGRGQPFSKRQFKQLREAMIARGLIRWNNPDAPAQGLALTHTGSAMVQTFAAMAASPTPALQDRTNG